jgi:hypothetical protein
MPKKPSKSIGGHLAKYKDVKHVPPKSSEELERRAGRIYATPAELMQHAVDKAARERTTRTNKAYAEQVQNQPRRKSTNIERAYREGPVGETLRAIKADYRFRVNPIKYEPDPRGLGRFGDKK